MGVDDVRSNVMATRNQRVGMNHPTVVPENFEDTEDEPTASDRSDKE